ncbi:DUF2842 domain-containing protein [Asticcacaulis sp. SL142]|jgi:Protein of unknown function (DUF2842)|uniref:DUF2842 domain-containing protein n=1 Tax=Asticcacaulis sp. SL142 TaxID=2995155 RepID=UPI00226D3F05|nr:DUF2842 domain-containing protein [Asticcacaulis sp. SL142]WAC49005.1 DUF2842 domain-containing protein [Asticcacaulis sp. SL142]
MIFKPLSLPVRRLIACAGVVVFLCVYVALVSNIAAHLPENKLIELLYYGLAGILWGIPVIPIISWSENYQKKNRH